MFDFLFNKKNNNEHSEVQAPKEDNGYWDIRFNKDYVCFVFMKDGVGTEYRFDELIGRIQILEKEVAELKQELFKNKVN